MSDYAHPKWYYQLLENLCVYLQAKHRLHLPCFSGDIAKICTYLGYFGHAWLNIFKMIITTCIGFWCLPACQKQTSSFTNFLIYYIVKNPVIWLADSILGNNLRPDVGFARWCGIGGEISIAILVFIVDNFQEKLQRKFFKKSTKPTLGLFCPNLGKHEFPWKGRLC